MTHRDRYLWFAAGCLLATACQQNTGLPLPEIPEAKSILLGIYRGPELNEIRVQNSEDVARNGFPNLVMSSEDHLAALGFKCSTGQLFDDLDNLQILEPPSPQRLLPEPVGAKYLDLDEGSWREHNDPAAQELLLHSLDISGNTLCDSKEATYEHIIFKYKNEDTSLARTGRIYSGRIGRNKLLLVRELLADGETAYTSAGVEFNEFTVSGDCAPGDCPISVNPRPDLATIAYRSFYARGDNDFVFVGPRGIYVSSQTSSIGYSKLSDLPELQNYTRMRISGSPRGSELEFYLVAEDRPIESTDTSTMTRELFRYHQGALKSLRKETLNVSKDNNPRLDVLWTGPQQAIAIGLSEAHGTILRLQGDQVTEEFLEQLSSPDATGGLTWVYMTLVEGYGVLIGNTRGHLYRDSLDGKGLALVSDKKKEIPQDGEPPDDLHLFGAPYAGQLWNSSLIAFVRPGGGATRVVQKHPDLKHYCPRPNLNHWLAQAPLILPGNRWMLFSFDDLSRSLQLSVTKFKRPPRSCESL